MAGTLADSTRPERLRAFARRAAAAYYEEVRPRAQARPLVSGRELMRRFGLAEGPRLGDIISRLRELQLEGTVATREAALTEAERLVGEMADEAEPTEPTSTGE